MVPFTNRHITRRIPFFPAQRPRVGNVARPDVVQRRMTVPAAEDQDVLLIMHGGMCAARWWALGCCYTWFRPCVGV